MKAWKKLVGWTRRGTPPSWRENELSCSVVFERMLSKPPLRGSFSTCGCLVVRATSFDASLNLHWLKPVDHMFGRLQNGVQSGILGD